MRGLHHLCARSSTTQSTEAMNGTCDRIDLWIHKSNEITVATTAAGFPSGPHPTQKDAKGKPMDRFKVVMTISTPAASSAAPVTKSPGGCTEWGVSVVNALASEMVVEVHRDGRSSASPTSGGSQRATVRTHHQAAAAHPAVGALAAVGKVTGTVTRFAPDEEMFPVIEWDTTIITLAARDGLSDKRLLAVFARRAQRG